MRSMARMSPVGFLVNFVGAVAGADGDGEGVALGLLDEVGGLLDVSEQLLAGHGAFGAVAVFLVAFMVPENRGRPVPPSTDTPIGMGEFDHLWRRRRCIRRRRRSCRRPAASRPSSPT